MQVDAKASCAAAVRSAKAAAKEAGQHIASSTAALAEKSEGHAEESCHKLIDQYGLALELPMTMVELHDGNEKYPVFLLSSWMDLILKLALARKIVLSCKVAKVCSCHSCVCVWRVGAICKYRFCCSKQGSSELGTISAGQPGEKQHVTS